jgi:hypothetical protein
VPTVKKHVREALAEAPPYPAPALSPADTEIPPGAPQKYRIKVTDSSGIQIGDGNHQTNVYHVKPD